MVTASKYKKTCSMSQVIREHLLKQQWCLISCFGDWEGKITVRFCKGESGTLMGEYVNWCSFLENHLTGSIKLKKNCLSFDSAVLCLGIFSAELFICVHKDGCSGQFILSLVVRAKRRENWTQPILLHHYRMVNEFILLIYLMSQYT